MIHDPQADDLDLTTIEAIGRLIRITVLITSGLIILQTLGFSVSGVLAFGGLGGIAVGFAAKDLLSNFFGGLMIFLDRPFGVGDWIRSPDRDIEGPSSHLGGGSPPSAPSISGHFMFPTRHFYRLRLKIPRECRIAEFMKRSVCDTTMLRKFEPLLSV